MHKNIEILNSLDIGSWIAEEEANDVKDYFLETLYWRDLIEDNVDIIFGPKGSGKSALYSHLISNESLFFEKNIIILKAENIKGSPIFGEIKMDPPTSENEFNRLWKLYFLILISQTLEEFKIKDESAQYIQSMLQQSGLIPTNKSFKSYLKSAIEYIKKFRGIKSITPGVGVNEFTGVPNKFDFKISFEEPDNAESERGIISIDSLFMQVNSCLLANGVKIWIGLDRLDVAFESSPEIEKRALRSLFRVYLDFLQFESLRLKVFLRDDIWKGIIEDGFREYSHITRKTTIEWDKSSLFILLMKRIIKNKVIRDEYQITEDDILHDIKKLEEVFSKIFPKSSNVGQKTFDWIISRTVDGKKINYPRNLIQLIKTAKHKQLKGWHNGEFKPADQKELFINKYLVAALETVSQTQTEVIFSEYPQCKTLINKLRKIGPRIQIDELKSIWGAEKQSEAKILFEQLDKIGFFENLGTDDKPIANIPILYRPYLKLPYT